jgi:tetratricopeptide (TPR) repeat protein
MIRWRSLAYRFRIPLTLLYLLVAGAPFAATAYFLDGRRVSPATDLGISIALRSLAYHRTFAEVELAREEFAGGLLAAAEARLERFVAGERDVQPSQLATHAVTDAYELLAEVYLARGKSGRAMRAMETICEIEARNYWVWYRLGQILDDRGDLAAAGDAFLQAFLLVPEHPPVAEAYLAVLAEQLDYARVLWAAEQFEWAQAHAAPQVLAKVGRPRGDLQRRALAWVEIPVEHASFFRTCHLTGLGRGAAQRVRLPPEMTMHWPAGDEPVTLQLRFEGIYEGLTVEALVATSAAGERAEQRLDPADLRTLHRPHSGAEWYVEIDTGRSAADLGAIVVVYSCPEARLSPETVAQVEHARRNLRAAGEGS